MATAPDLPPLIGESPAFLELLDHVSRLAPLDRPLLVVGERGTGKELIAARLHYLSQRWDQSYVKLNCAALPKDLLESELFGHEAGAFTGAARRRVGRFEAADDGTLFLDEIANAGAAVQEKILHTVEYGSFERVGSNEPIAVDVRVIGATNVDPRREVAAGRFRADLLDRLAFDVVTVPPLRARPQDVPILAQHFGAGMARALGWPRFRGFTSAALADLAAYRWPGNVRELRNVVERALARAPAPDRLIGELTFDPFESRFAPKGRIAADATTALPAEPSRGGDDVPDIGRGQTDYRTAVAAYERRILSRALDVNRHNQRATARHLGLSYHQLRNALRKHALN